MVLNLRKELAVAAKAEVILVQVVPPRYGIALAEGYTSHLDRISQEYIRPASAAARDYLNAIKEKLLKKGITAHSEVVTGSLGEKIIDCAGGKGVDLITMSTHGHSGIGRWLLGSVADKVLHAADRPVLLVRAWAKT